MGSELRLDCEVSPGSAKAPPLIFRLAPDLAEQVELLTDQPSQSVMYSDLYDHLRSGVRNFRRLLPSRHAHLAR